MPTQPAPSNTKKGASSNAHAESTPSRTQEPAETSGDGAASSLRTADRGALIVGVPVLLLVAILYVVALQQTPRSDPHAAPSPSSLTWWLYPYETHAFERLPQVSGPLRSVDVDPRTGEVWAVGDGGLILRSRDGVHWRPDTTLLPNALPDSLRPTLDLYLISFEGDQGLYDAFLAGPEARIGRRDGEWVFVETGGSSSTVSFDSQTATVISPKEDTTEYTFELQNDEFEPQNDEAEPTRTRTDALTASELELSVPTVLPPVPDDTSRLPVNVSGFSPDGAGWWTSGGRVYRAASPQDDPDLVDVGTRARLYDIAFASDRQRGWVVGEWGTLLATSDGGDSWHPQTRPTRSVHAVHRNGTTWTMLRATPVDGAAGAILTSTDGGTSWRRQAISEEIRTYSAALTSKRGAIVTRPGRLLVSQDARWFEWSARLDSSGGVQIPAFTSGGGLVGFSGRPPTKSKIPQEGQAESAPATVEFEGDPLPEGASFRHATMASNTVGWALGWTSAFEGGGRPVLLRTTDAGRRWTVVDTSSTWTDASAIAAASATSVWRALRDGRIQRSVDGGDTWASLAALPARADSGGVITALDVSQEPYLALTAGGGAFQSDDGTAWSRVDLVAYDRKPAPWYVVVVLLLFSGVAFVVSRRMTAAPVEAETPSIADFLLSDRPLRPGDPDALDLNRVAGGLSRFFRNPSTDAPLTVAITGAWGTGKSSLMNLLRGDLKLHGIRPVWFNAWHHQTETNLLAALLENIRSQAIPPWWSPAAWEFRARLLWDRTKRHLPTAFAVVVGSILTLGYLHQSGGYASAVAQLNELSVILANGDRAPGDGVLALLVDSAVAFGLPVAWLVAIGTALRNGLVAFGASPARLMASLRRNAGVRDLELQTSYRYRFKQEFDHVTRALGPRPMVVFIDDLDRCKRENVFTVLEAVNFLSDAGRCFIVLGMDYDRVLRHVRDGLGDDADDSFARRYLEKLVNVTVPVPEADDDALIRVILGLKRADASAVGHDEAPSARHRQEDRTARVPDDPASRRDRLVRRLQSAAWWARGVCLAGILGLATMYAVPGADVLTLFHDDSLVVASSGAGAEAGEPGTSSNAEADAATAAGNAVSPASSLESTATRTSRTLAPSFLSRSRTADPWSLSLLGWGLFPVAGLVGLGVLFVLSKPRVIVPDSKSFKDGIRIWDEVIAHHFDTPRAMKRFVNGIRFHAMSTRPTEPPPSRIRTLVDRVYPPPSSPEAPQLPEDALVALCVLRETDSAFSHLEAYLTSGSGRALQAGALQAEVQAGLERHASEYPSLHADDPQAPETFREALEKWAALLEWTAPG